MLPFAILGAVLYYVVRLCLSVVHALVGLTTEAFLELLLSEHDSLTRANDIATVAYIAEESGARLSLARWAKPLDAEWLIRTLCVGTRFEGLYTHIFWSFF